MFRLFCVILAVKTLAPALGDSAFTVADEPKNAAGEKQIAVDLGDGAQLKLALIPSGIFMMGSGESAEVTAAFFKNAYDLDYPASALDTEHPQHRVRITKPFYLGVYDLHFPRT